MRVLGALALVLVTLGCGDGGGDTSMQPKERFWVSASGRLLVSKDEGATWRTAFTGDQQPIRGLAFTDDGRGAAVGRGRVIFTRDGGARWATIRSVASDSLQDVAIGSDGRGIAVGATLGPGEFDSVPLVLETSDAGAHWTVAELPAGLAAETSGFVATCLTASGTALVIGESAPVVLRRDAAEWVDISEHVPFGAVTVACRGEDVWIGGRSLSHSSDGGRT
jgi:hypothetical protein